jgi:hypothetical protein
MRSFTIVMSFYVSVWIYQGSTKHFSIIFNGLSFEQATRDARRLNHRGPGCYDNPYGPKCDDYHAVIMIDDIEPPLF